MAWFGEACLWLAIFLCCYGIISAYLGRKAVLCPEPSPLSIQLLESSRRSTFCLFFAALCSSIALISLLISNDFSIKYVFEHSSLKQPIGYRFSSFWGGQEGSLLFWATLVTAYASLIAISARRRYRALYPWTSIILNAIILFFLTLLISSSSPFALVLDPNTGLAAFPPPSNGLGLNPLLQNPLMQIHPPCLYLGFTAFAIPFAIACSALITKRLEGEWLTAVRRWVLFSWFFLGIGIILGGYWAYLELGWGGYWGWDPVENASFLPWLTATAFLHSVMIQEKKGMLKIWNMFLVFLTFFLVIFGTFLTRSGIITSVHAFAKSPLALHFQIFMGVIIAGVLYLLITRRKLLQSESRLDSVFSKESAFLMNNWVILGGAFTVLIGTIYPVLSGMFLGKKLSVGPVFYNRVFIPISLIILFLTGLGPMIAWRHSSWNNFKRNLLGPAAAGIVTAGFAAFQIRNLQMVLVMGISSFVLCTIFLEFYRGTKARMTQFSEKAPTAFFRLIFQFRRRYGGYIVHLAVVMIFLGIAASSIFQQHVLRHISEGETIKINDYQITLIGLKELKREAYEGIGAILKIQHAKAQITMMPEKRYYPNPVNPNMDGQPTTEVAIWSRMSEDFYIVLSDLDVIGDEVGNGAYFEFYRNPLVGLIWLGGILMVFGAGICLFPEKSTKAIRKAMEKAT